MPDRNTKEFHVDIIIINNDNNRSNRGQYGLWGKEENQPMFINDTHCSFRVLVEHEVERDLLKIESELNEKLIKHGVTLRFAPCRDQGSKGLSRFVISINFDKETVSRGAGRKPVECGITIEEAIRMENAGEDKAAIAEKMGISLPTYYRRRKKYYDNKE